ncbi:MAG: WG repeat-containing protein [Bacteroidia bacterium]|nr:WG repeat-containing protein [Bacteroidia bacterium]
MRNYIKHFISIKVIISMIFVSGMGLSAQGQEIEKVFQVRCNEQPVYIAKEKEGFNIINDTWEPIIDVRYDTISLLDDFLLSAISDGKQVLLTCQGTPVSPQDMESVYMYADDELRGLYFIRNTRDKYGVIDYNGKTIIPFEFERIEHLSIHKYLFAIKNNEKYYFDYMGNVLFK